MRKYGKIIDRMYKQASKVEVLLRFSQVNEKWREVVKQKVGKLSK
ncbi:hypothetical protein LCGC14_0946190 [marine sediment metagenome]|uniref:Uncharacterized protein n=1 Tax=marine sediment metagenome TaxID=412755 RepID=A0A0F9RQ32_9ZZZZ